ncbi:alpha/beta hydrolase fold domain-containing protein [Streptomyces sp. NPDC051976]|uniref:alpha/beta hydrolase fold domain-containing protein n=1 Tax=Streptomyces sp. NPDC051976 TaxID=3154947 RepID=UPI0034221484
MLSETGRGNRRRQWPWSCSASRTLVAPSTIAQASTTRDYRLAPEHPHPAAVEDATALLRWARPTAVAGDSAGGFPPPRPASRCATRAARCPPSGP